MYLNYSYHSHFISWSKATRNPISMFVTRGEQYALAAQRQLRLSNVKSPPRTTLPVPVSGPVGFQANSHWASVGSAPPTQSAKAFAPYQLTLTTGQSQYPSTGFHSASSASQMRPNFAYCLTRTFDLFSASKAYMPMALPSAQSHPSLKMISGLLSSYGFCSSVPGSSRDGLSLPLSFTHDTTLKSMPMLQKSAKIFLS